ncbi:hypothetical protein [Asticcacaulis sp. MM231]|uniref:hypothetical protein n=1 Tax=Asticcacaulis sp. MM231 TaxID=3157666 RepID=UPI0032D56BD0
MSANLGEKGRRCLTGGGVKSQWEVKENQKPHHHIRIGGPITAARFVGYLA